MPGFIVNAGEVYTIELHYSRGLESSSKINTNEATAWECACTHTIYRKDLVSIMSQALQKYPI